MFQSIAYIHYEGWKNGLHHSQHYIDDSDFGREKWVGVNSKQGRSTAGSIYNDASAIINCYEDKKLDVPLNLALYHLYMRREHGGWYRIEDNLAGNIEYVPGYEKYVAKTREYLVRLDKMKAMF